MLNRILDATDEPVTLEAVKASLILTGADDDTKINDYIKTARQLVENFAHMSLLPQTWELSVPIPSTSIIELPRPPIQAILNIKYVDTDGKETVFDADNYFLDTLNECVQLSDASTWEIEGVLYYKVYYLTGYAAVKYVPEGFKQAIILTAHHLYEHQDAFDMPTGAIKLVPFRRRLF